MAGNLVQSPVKNNGSNKNKLCYNCNILLDDIFISCFKCNSVYFMAINVREVVPKITRNFVHQYLNCKNKLETR